jgi:mRNA capping enzyme, C-terminal domain/mRNA capping enzyme, catalytic domain
MSASFGPSAAPGVAAPGFGAPGFAAPSGTAAAKPAGGTQDPAVIEVDAVRLEDLFPEHQLRAAKARCKEDARGGVAVGGGQGTVWRVRRPLSCEFGRRVHEAVAQVFRQTERRHRRLPIEDDEFFHADRMHRVEQARKFFREGTRLFSPFSGRKTPLNTFLHPPALSTDRRYTLRSVEATRSAADERQGQEGAEDRAVPEFPGSVPVSLMEEDIERVLWDSAYAFVWAGKTDGLRFFAVACHLRHDPWLLLVNRAQEIYIVPRVRGPEALFDGTILDGELVATHSGGFAYVAYDCAIACGVPCAEYNYLVRLQLAALLLETWAAPTPRRRPAHPLDTEADEKMDEAEAGQGARGASGAPFEWRVKRVFMADRLVELLERELPSLDHETDGLIATAVEPPIQVGQTRTIFKVKRATDHTIDLLANVLNPPSGPAPHQPSGPASHQPSGPAPHQPSGPAPSWPVYVDLLAVDKGDTGPRLVRWDTLELAADEWAALAARLAPSRSAAAAGSAGPLEAAPLEARLHHRIVECRFNAARVGVAAWEIECVRADKSMPNKLSTAHKTWQNIQEDLSLARIFSKGTLSANHRDRLLRWEREHPTWRPKPGDALAAAALPAATPTAPVPLAHLISF